MILDIFSALLPTRCILCEVEGEFLCDSCWIACDGISSESCFNGNEKRCYRCDELYFDSCELCSFTPDSPFRFIRSVKYLNSSLRTAIHAGKYHGYFAIFSYLAHKLYEYHNDSTPHLTYDSIIPIPSHFMHVWRRGYLHTNILSSEFLRRDSNIHSIKLRNCQFQRNANLKLRDRIRYSRKRFKFIDRPLGRVLIIDDILTTGSNAVAVARVIQSNAQSIDLLSVARSRNFVKFFPQVINSL